MFAPLRLVLAISCFLAVGLGVAAPALACPGRVPTPTYETVTLVRYVTTLGRLGGVLICVDGAVVEGALRLVFEQRIRRDGRGAGPYDRDASRFRQIGTWDLLPVIGQNMLKLEEDRPVRVRPKPKIRGPRFRRPLVPGTYRVRVTDSSRTKTIRFRIGD